MIYNIISPDNTFENELKYYVNSIGFYFVRFIRVIVKDKHFKLKIHNLNTNVIYIEYI